MNLRNDFSCETFLGTGAFLIVVIFSSVGWRPFSDILYPRYSTNDNMTEQFSLFRGKPACFRCCSIFSRLWRCSSMDFQSPKYCQCRLWCQVNHVEYLTSFAEKLRELMQLQIVRGCSDKVLCVCWLSRNALSLLAKESIECTSKIEFGKCRSSR